MNIDVAERLIENLEASLNDDSSVISHNQNVWLTDHTDVFVISEDNKWGCATDGCAAGFIYLEEAPIGFVFDAPAERVFPSQAAHKAFKNKDDGFEYGTKIDSWAADILDIDYDQLIFLFYQFGTTEETINRVKFLMKHDDIGLFNSTEVY